jgi:hypothetical protein
MTKYFIMSFESGDETIDREVKYYHMPTELFVSPVTARKFIFRLSDTPSPTLLEEFRQQYQQADWGSHIERAILSIALEVDETTEFELIQRITDEMVAYPQQLSEMVGISMIDGAMARARMALFDARRIASTETPTLEQFLSHWH